MSAVRVVFGKWGERPHWEYDAVRLGDDDHGLWLGLPEGTSMARPGARFTTTEAQVVLVPPCTGYVATFFEPGGRAPCHTYVDITTVPAVADGAVRMVDLDLDVIRGWAGRVWVDDEDEFVDHRVRFGYPAEVVDHAVTTCEDVRRAVERREGPFDDATAGRWLDVLRESMM